VVFAKKTGTGPKPKLEIGIYYEIYTDLIFANCSSQIDRWTMNDMSIFWLKLQNKTAIDNYVANPPTKQVGKTTQIIPIKFPY
jgi:hypothetical protein